jgi:DNA-binding IclR family transcriptional regulator
MPQARRSGTQSIERAVAVLRDVAAHYRQGARLTDIAQRCEIDRGTACRVLACLVRENLVEQRRSDKRYMPGQGLFELGLSVADHRALQEVSRQSMERAARRFSGSSFVYVRSGVDVVCIARSDHEPMRGAMAQPGTRRPMPALAAGLAILTRLSPDEAGSIVTNYLEQLAQEDRVNASGRRKMVQRSLKLGYGFNDGYVARGLASVAVPILDLNDRPFASLSVVNIGDPSFAQRAEEVAASLRKESESITQRLSRRASPLVVPRDESVVA